MATKIDKKWEYDEYYLGQRDGNNYRTGQGENYWISAEFINMHEGAWLRDFMHGVGEYRWLYQGKTPDLHATYEGTFFANHLDGYGCMSYADGRVYRGLYKLNTRYGPGVESRPDMRANVGMWCGNQLIRLAWRLPQAHIIPDFSNDINVAQIIEDNRPKLYPVKKPFFDFAEISTTTSKATVGSTPSSLTNQGTSYEKLFISTEDATLIDNISKTPNLFGSFQRNEQVYNEELFAKTIFGKDWEELIDLEKAMQLCNLGTKPCLTVSVEAQCLYNAWNPSHEMVSIMKHCYRYKQFNPRVADVDVKAIISGHRGVFKPPDTHELDCRSLLLACYLGDVKAAMRLVNECNVYVDIMDAKGNTPLMYACCGDRQNIISFLLTAGAKVNRLNDDCVSALTITILRYLAALNGGVAIEDFSQAFVPLNVLRHVELNIIPTEWLLIKNGSSEGNKKQAANKSAKGKQKGSSRKSLQTLNTVSEDDVANFRNDHVYHQLLAAVKAQGLEHSLTSKNSKSSKSSRLSLQRQNFYRLDVLFERLDFCKNGGVSTEIKDSVRKSVLKLNHEDDKNTAKIAAAERTVFQLIAIDADTSVCRFPLPTLALAVLTKQVELVSTLIEKGERINQCFFQLSNLTPLLIAFSDPYSKEAQQVIEYLLKIGANANQRQSVFYPNVKSKELIDTFTNLIGPGILHLTVMMKPNTTSEAEVQASLIKTLLDYGAEPSLLYLEHTPVDLVMLSDIPLLGVFLSHTVVDPNMTITTRQETILSRLFNYSYFRSKVIKQLIEAMNVAFKYGADPFIPIELKNHSSGNLFAYAAEQYSVNNDDADIYNKTRSESGLRSKFSQHQQSQSETAKAANKASKTVTKSPETSITAEQYESMFQNAAKVGRELVARRIRGKLMLKLCKICLTNVFRHWTISLNEVTFRPALISWLSTQYVTYIWDAFVKKYPSFNKSKILFSVLCVTCYLQRMGNLNEAVSRDVMKWVEFDAKECRRRYKQSKEDFGEQVHYILPEFDEQASKYNVCYECLQPLHESVMKCHVCHVAPFCSKYCFKKSLERPNVHMCLKYFKDQFEHKPSSDEA